MEKELDQLLSCEELLTLLNVENRYELKQNPFAILLYLFQANEIHQLYQNFERSILIPYLQSHSRYDTLTKALKENDAESQYQLSEVAMHKQLYWLRRAASQNHKKASAAYEFENGKIYEFADEDLRDLEAARSYYEKAIQLGSQEAIVALKRVKEKLGESFLDEK